MNYLEKKHKIYQIRNLINNKLYIGYTHKELKIRFKEHCNGKKYAINHAIKKYGKENFIITLIEAFEDKTLSLLKEKQLIKELNTIKFGYNSVPGGQGGWSPNPLTVSERTKNIWSNQPEKMINAKNALLRCVEDKKITAVLVHLKTKEIIKFKNLNQLTEIGFTCYTFTTKNYALLTGVDLNLSNEEYIRLAEEKIECKLEDWNIGKRSWVKCDKESRIKKIQEATLKQRLPILRVDINSGNIFRYNGVNEAVADGYSTFGIYDSLNRTAKTGQKNVWFYDKGQLDEHFTKEALNILGSFKTKFATPLEGIDLENNSTMWFKDIYEASEYTNIKVKTISRHLKGDKGYANYIKGWKFQFIS
jgi:group I intron endonuclease